MIDDPLYHDGCADQDVATRGRSPTGRSGHRPHGVHRRGSGVSSNRARRSSWRPPTSRVALIARTRAACPDSSACSTTGRSLFPTTTATACTVRGNVVVSPHVGLLFPDFEHPKRLRVNGTASISADDRLRDAFRGCLHRPGVLATRIFPNCPRYLHGMQLVEPSVYSPRPDYEPPVPAWKTFDVFRDALPARDRIDDPKR